MAEVTVIIPTYNHSRFVANAVESVLTQTFCDTEVIVVDDGSTDNTRDVIAQFGDRVRYIWQENQGLSAARNTGIAHATGRLINFLDADDWHSAEFLQTLVTHLNTHPHLDGVACGFQFATAPSQLLPQTGSHSISAENLYSRLLNGNLLAVQCYLIKRSGLPSFDTRLTACEDWDAWLNLSKKFCIELISSILTYVRVLDGSMSGNPQRMLVNRLAVLNKHCAADSSPRSRRAYAQAYFRTAIEYLGFGRTAQAIQCLQVAVQCDPLLYNEPEFLYELAFSLQNRGTKEGTNQWDGKQSAALIRTILTTLNPDLLPSAYCLLAKLNFQQGQKKEARHHWHKALLYDPLLIRHDKLFVRLIRTYF